MNIQQNGDQEPAQTSTLPPRFAELKRQLIPKDEEGRKRLVESWKDIVSQLRSITEQIHKDGSNTIPQIDFDQLKSLSEADIDAIKRKGSVLVKNVVDDAQAIRWRENLRNFVTDNPVEGAPADNKQFFQLFWTQPQVQARAHPNVLQLISWLNNLYHVKGEALDAPSEALSGVQLSKPLAYADRFRIRQPGVQWDVHPPHIDGGGIERWEDDSLRTCFQDILEGNWRKHDPYDLVGRLQAKTSMYGRPNQSSVFRTFQGWLALSDTAPHQGTLKVFPDVHLSNAYLILRPFFKLKESRVSDDSLDPDNWELDLSSSVFPGIFKRENEDGFFGPRLTDDSHPHMLLEKNMTSVPPVKPGDMVFWHCDVVHSVEREHTGTEDSAVMYIPAVPFTPQNLAYIERQREAFLQGASPPDFPKTRGEANFSGVGHESDISNEAARRAMGFAY